MSASMIFVVQLVLMVPIGEYSGNRQHRENIIGKPTLPLLLKFPSSCSKSIINNCINIPVRIGQKYWSFGILLLQDNTGNIVEALEHESQKNAEMINLKILQKWINGVGLPVSWDVLIQVLHDIELHELADEMYNIFVSEAKGQC